MAWEPYAESRRRFERDVADHELTIIRDDGNYRHLRCRRPDTISMYFDIVSWPGYLVITGDVDTYVFSREEDMFGWFLGRNEPRTEISPEYWSQKIQGDRSGRDISRRYSHEAFRREMREWVRRQCEEAEFDGGGMYESLLWEAVEREVLADDTTHQEEAYERIRDLARWDDIEIDTWEWDLKDFDPWFLWCCHAILWAIHEYRAATAPMAVAV